MCTQRLFLLLCYKASSHPHFLNYFLSNMGTLTSTLTPFPFYHC